MTLPRRPDTPTAALAEAIALWRDRCALVSTQDVGDAATVALVADVDSPSLRELAGVPHDADRSDVEAVVAAVVTELGLEVPDAGTARRTRARAVLEGRLAGEVPCRDAARLIAGLLDWLDPDGAQLLQVIEEHGLLGTEPSTHEDLAASRFDLVAQQALSG